MGRLAGDSIASQRNKTWKEQVAEAREEKAGNGDRPPEPLSAPGAARRRMALLWWLGAYSGETTLVGARGAVPLTPDMRFLLAQGYLTLSRRSSGMLASPLRRENELRITAAGKLALTAARVTEAEKAYIIAARRNRMLR